MILVFIDKILALLKEIVLAGQFGISASMDVFNVALAVPGITILMFSGTFISAFVPIYIGWSTNRSRSDADAKSCNLFLLVTLGFTVISLVGYPASPFLFSLAGYGFNAESRQLGATLEGLLMLMLWFDGAGIVLAGILHARKQFIPLYAAPLCVNLAVIGAVTLAAPMGIHAMVWGTVLGTLAKTLVMLFFLLRHGFFARFEWLLAGEDLRALMVVGGPLFVGQLIANSNLLVDQVMAGGLSPGSVSSLRYAFRINDLPIQLLVLSLSRTIFPYISEMAAEKDYSGLRQVFSYSIIILAFLTFPITCFAFLFAEDAVRLILQRGAFDPVATKRTGEILICYSSGLFFSAYAFVNSAFFSAMKDTLPLLRLGLLSILLNIGLNFLFMKFMGVNGIALSTTAGNMIVSGAFAYMLQKRLGFQGVAALLVNVSRLFAAALSVFVLGLAMDRWVGTVHARNWVSVCLSVAVLSASYMVFVLLFRTPEIESCLSFLRERILAPGLFRKKRPEN